MPDFTLLNNFFEHVYVISLQRHTDRQEKMKEVLEGLNYSFFRGMDKKNLTIDLLVEKGIYNEEKAKELHRYDKPMNTGQIGRAWTHRLVYEDIVLSGYKKVLILEDNVVLNNAGFLLLENMIEQLPADWELWYLDYHNNLRRDVGSFFVQTSMHFRRLIGKLKLTPTAIDNFFARKFSENLFRAGYHDLTTAYALTLPAAKKLIELQTPVTFCSDNLLAHACTNLLINGYVSVPKIFLKETFLIDRKTKESYLEE
ncbi:MAG TPA: glycosyltransferase family 25 protein [Segetibacter sp.]|jgi:glycosyl transferase family 25